MASTVLRRCGGNQSPRIDGPTVAYAASPTPMMARLARSAPKPPANPAATVATLHTSTPAPRIAVRRSDRAIAPKSGLASMYDTRKTLVSSPMSASSAPKAFLSGSTIPATTKRSR